MRTSGLLSLLLLVGGCSADAVEGDRKSSSIKIGPFLSIPFEDACRLAGEQGKVVFIDFFTTWCGPCKMLDRTTWKDEAVVALLNEKTIPLKVDAEKTLALSSRYRVNAYPTLVFLRPDGSEIDRLVGYRDAKTFLSEAVGSLAGKTALVRARDDVEATGGEDPVTRSGLARELASRGEYEEALRHYLWCWDHGDEERPSWTGVRVSFLLGDIKDLAAEYPRAEQAMIERRDAVAEKLLSGEFDWKTASDLGALNNNFGASGDSLAVFDELAGQGDQAERARRVLLRHVLDDLLEAKRYTDILAVSGPVSSTVARELESYRDVASRFPDDLTFKPHYLRQASRWYKVLIGAGKDELAESIAKRLLRFDDSPETYRLLANHAEHAGNDETAARWRALIR